MKFFSGFSLKDESKFFAPFIKESEQTVCGFSYGAIKAFEYVKKTVAEGGRIDTLQLWSKMTILLHQPTKCRPFPKRRGGVQN